MEKIFKSEFKSTRTNSSKLLLNITKDKNKKYLYQARDIGYEYNQAGYYHKTENGNSHLIAYTKSGNAVLEYDDQTINLGAGSLIFINLAKKRVIKVESGHWEIYFMHVFGSDIDEIYKTVVNSKSGYYFEKYDEEKIVSQINRVYELYNSHERDYCEISVQIYAILMDILKKSQPNEYPKIVSKAISYMNKNYASQFTIEDLCKDLFVSKYFFIRKFHEETGISPKRYLTKLRIEKAKLLLVQTNKSILEIAVLSGFENEKNIYYAFKKELNISPKDYRDNYFGGK